MTRDTESGAPALPNIDVYLRKAQAILETCPTPEARNALIERELDAWQQRYAAFVAEPEPWLAKYPHLTTFDFAETIAGLSRLAA